MTTFTYIVKRKLGLHARPAALIATRVNTMDDHVTVIFGDKTADAHDMKQLLALGVKCGDEITFAVEGDNEETNAAQLKEICTDNI